MLCILVSVYFPYRWVAEYTARTLDAFWPAHPPVFFCGLTTAEAGALPHLPCKDSSHPRNWAAFVHDAAAELRVRGFRHCYFLLEDQPPFAPCSDEHLSTTLPRLMEELNAAYLGLMGWDNRRYTTRAPLLPAAQHRLMHLNVPRAPRFHLHPSLWRLDALEACAALTMRHAKPTPWTFEKTCGSVEAPLPIEWRQGCYQISAEALMQPGLARLAAARTERFLYHRLMALAPLAQKLGCGLAYWDALGFDDFLYPGPYPIFYAGVMSRGRFNPFLRRWIEKQREPHPLLVELLRASRRNDE